jgi:hypothetical protein
MRWYAPRFGLAGAQPTALNAQHDRISAFIARVGARCKAVVAAVRCCMADPARRRRTFEEMYAEIARLPEGMTGEILEVEDDVVRVMSRPGKRHRRAAGACLDALSGANANLRGSGWWIQKYMRGVRSRGGDGQARVGRPT